MRNFFSILLTIIIISLMAFLLSNCKKPERIIKIRTLSVTAEDIAYNVVTIKGEIIDAGETPINDHGIEIRKKDQGDSKYTALSRGSTSSEKVFTVLFYDVEPSTSYEYRAYAENNSQKIYGSTRTFTSLALELPALSTRPATDIGLRDAVSGGIISSDGGDLITSRGVCWSTQENPSTDNEIIEDTGTGTGEFTVTLSQLVNGTVYYARAYATNSIGTSYGNQVRFTTYYGTATDTVGNDYFTVKIGEQEWMAQNLHTTKYADGIDIPAGLSDTEWSNTSSGAYAIQPHEEMENLNSDEEVLEAYGALYNGYAVQTGKLCPDGWRVPTDEDWSVLLDYLVNNYEEITVDNVGNYLKSCRQVDSPLDGYCNTSEHPRWNAHDTQHGNDYFNFSALPGGGRNGPGVFWELGFNAFYRTSTMVSYQGSFWQYSLRDEKGSVERQDTDFGAGASIRCLKGESAVVTLPVLTTATVTDITESSASCGGEVTDDGGDAISARGVVWGTGENPSTETNTGLTSDGSGTGSFTSEITGLTPETTYYVRAYATNSIGTAYGNQLSFETNPLPPDTEPTVTTAVVSSITQSSASCGGEVTDDGGDAVSARGVVWGTAENPTTETNTGSTNDGSGIGSFTSEITGLDPATTYYVRAYAKNSLGTAYGGQVSFITDAVQPSISTADITSITSNSAIGGGEVTDDGGDAVSARGVVWGTDENPTTETNIGSTNDGSGTGSFTSEITGLDPATTYYVRAYAKNSVGTAYGGLVSFKTDAAQPSISTADITGITQNSASGGGEVTNDGGDAVSARGVVWGTAENPTTETNTGSTNDGSGIGSFTSEITGLDPATTYYVRAYATNSIGTAYGNQVEFTTITLPTLSTEAVINIDHQSAESGGNISSDGGSPVTKKGICWDTSPDPTTDSNTGFTNDGEGTGIFSSSMTGLEANTKYYVRAYATNSAGTAYGNQLEFTTERNPDLPAVTTATVVNITSYAAVSGGDISDQGSGEVLLRGVCWSQSVNPTIDDEYTEDGAGTGTYTSNITGLYSGTRYYVRAFATNSYGIAYGDELSFTTLPGASTVEIKVLRSKPGLVSVDADIIRDGGAAITGRGFVWGTSPDPDLAINSGYSTEGTGSGPYTGEISGLSINTDYYVRAWATNSEGTSYSGQLLFHFWDYGTTTDIDGNSYNTVTIGSQVWMAENLRVARYTTAIPIPGGLTDEEWETTTSGAYAVYPHGSVDGLNSEEEVLDAYGALYNWYAVETGNLCPTGWRVPTDADWTQLSDHMVNNYDSVTSEYVDVYLRSCRQVDSPLGADCATTEHPRWKSYDKYGIDFFGFSGLPGGFRWKSGYIFNDLGEAAYWWTSSSSPTARRIYYATPTYGTNRVIFGSDSPYKESGLSIRCIKE